MSNSDTMSNASSSTAAAPADAGILLVGFGSSDATARAVYDRIDAAAATRFPGLPRRWAFTSGFVRRRLAREGVVLDSVVTGLGRLLDDGVKRVAIQSIHVIAGGEYEHVRDMVERLHLGRDGFAATALGGPLLSSFPELERAVRALLAVVPAAERQAGDAIIVMGHGTAHPGDLAYAAADAALRRLDPRAMLATLEGYPTFDDALAQCLALGARRAWLVPFVVVPGGHVKVDMAGDGPAAWTHRLAAAGIEPLPIRQGCGEHPAIVDIWLDHLADALARL